MHLVARPWQEAPLLAAAHAYEQATDWHRRLPAEVESRKSKVRGDRGDKS
jgi:hypothetical protein